MFKFKQPIIITFIISFIGRALTDGKGVIDAKTAQHSSLVPRMKETVSPNNHLKWFCIQHIQHNQQRTH